MQIPDLVSALDRPVFDRTQLMSVMLVSVVLLCFGPVDEYHSFITGVEGPTMHPLPQAGSWWMKPG